MSHLEHRNLAMLHAAERLVRECSITEKQAQELISLLGLEWSSLVREARLIVKGATRKVDFRRCKESHLETVCSEARRASDKPQRGSRWFSAKFEPERLVQKRSPTDFMTSTDPVAVNRNGWLLYEMNCDVGRRYRELAG